MHENQKFDEEKVIETIKSQIAGNNILLYMKGTPKMPQCGFSAHVAAAIQACGKPFAFVNILENPDIRAVLPKYANWPTFPQLYVNMELIGGCDIILDLHKNGELQEIINQVK